MPSPARLAQPALRDPARPFDARGLAVLAGVVAVLAFTWSDLALTDDFAYLPDQAGRIVRVPLAGGALQTVADVHGVPFGVATNGLALYWSTLGNGAIYRLRLSGDAPVEAIAPVEQDPHFLAVSSAAVFWGAWGGGGTIRKFAR